MHTLMGPFPLRTSLPHCGQENNMAAVMLSLGVELALLEPLLNSLPSSLWSSGSELFTGLYSDYWGRDAAIFRLMGRLAHIRTEPDDERLLKGTNVLPLSNNDADEDNSGSHQHEASETLFQVARSLRRKSSPTKHGGQSLRCRHVDGP